MAILYGFIGCYLAYTNLPKLLLQKYDTLRLPSRSIFLGNQNINIMLIQTDKYQPNSLRKGRVQALEKDLSDSYSLFCNRLTDPKITTMNDFLSFWSSSQLKFLVYIKNEDEDEQEYYQVIYKILMHSYFLKGNQSKKIYCLLCIYFFAYTVDINGDRNPRPIHVTIEFINALNSFLRDNSDFTNYLFIKVVKKIKDQFVYSIKTGPRDPLIKKNGDTFIRYPKPVKKLTRDNYSPAILQIKEVMPELSATIQSYQESKDKFFKLYKSEETASLKKQMNFDKNITIRLNQILSSYDAQVTYVEQDLKHMADEANQNES